MEPYASEVMRMARKGDSMQSIANWLAQSPRGVTISRQAVHQWVRARIKKLAKLNDTFACTGMGGPYEEGGATEPSQRPSDTRSSNAMAPGAAEPPPPRAALAPPQGAPKRVDMSEFQVDESEWNRSRNPLMPKQ